MISVFTPTHRPQTLSAAYKSLLKQTYQDWEWVIVVNNTTEEVPAEISNDARVTVTTSTATSIGTLKRTACEACKGEWLVELDHDDELLPTCLEQISKSEADFVYSNAIRQETFGEIGFLNGWEYRDHELGWETVSPASFPSNLSRIWFAPDHVRAWRKSEYWRIGGHSDMMVADDHELICRSYINGLQFQHIDEPLYIYNVHADNTWSQHAGLIEELMWRNHDRYFFDMQVRWSKEQNLRLIDLGGGINSAPGFETYDLRNATITGDLNKKWKLPNDSVGLLRAHDIVEHLKDPVHTMNEAYRVLTHGGLADILVPSTDGQGAWCDPTHVSYWNLRSFRYYTDHTMRRYIEPKCNARFQVIKLTNVVMWNIPYVHAQLLAIKEGPRFHGELLI